MTAPYCHVNDPWDVLSALRCREGWREGGLELYRPGFIVTIDDIKLYSSGAAEPLPSQLVTSADRTFRVIELPGPAISGDKSYKDAVEIRNGDNRVGLLQLVYRHSAKTESPGKDVFEAFFDEILDELIFIVYNIMKTDSRSAATVFWHDLLSELKLSYGEDPAKHALIVELAEFIGPPLERIAGNPKKALRRIRDQERIQNIRETDTRCIMDLARRPGRTLAEKAGPRQRILSIKRQENIDILENQVALHCSELLFQSARRYLHSHAGVEHSRRKELVDALHACCKRLMGSSTFKGISRLRTPCRIPNYTLLQNTYYAKVWKAYNRLLKNEQLRDVLWRWSRRLWSEYLAIFLADTLLRWQQSLRLPVTFAAGEKIVQARLRHCYGRWFVDDVMPGPFVFGIDSDHCGTLFLIDGASTGFLGPDANCLSGLHADYLFVWLCAESSTVLPVYAAVKSASSEGDPGYDETAARLLAELELFNTAQDDWTCVGAWIVLGGSCQKHAHYTSPQVRHPLYCWVSNADPAPMVWQQSATAYFEPLSCLTGLGDHVYRN